VGEKLRAVEGRIRQEDFGLPQSREMNGEMPLGAQIASERLRCDANHPDISREAQARAARRKQGKLSYKNNL
jgi:hypothetical protein